MKNKYNHLILPILIIAIMVVLIAVFTKNGASTPTQKPQVLSTENALGTGATETTPFNAQTAETLVRLYGKMASETFKDDLFIINRAEIKSHETLYGRGVQYGIVISKFTNELTEEHTKVLYTVIGKLLKDTTENIVAKDPSISYVAIQVLLPELWAKGFAGEIVGYGYLYVAKRNDLLAFLEMEDETLDWVGAAQMGTVELVDSTILYDLMDKNLAKKRKQTEKGFEFPR